MVYQGGAAGVITQENNWMGWSPSTMAMVVSTRLTRDGTQLNLVREISCGDEAIVLHVCWSRNHTDAEEAGEVFEALMRFQEHFVFWSAGALALGTDWLAVRLQDIVTARLDELADERKRSADAELAALRKEEEERVYEAAIHAYFKEKKGWFVVEFKKGRCDRPFWTIRFDEAWERDRFWDWMAWQLDRYDEYLAFLSGNPHLELERKLLREMLVTEQTVKKQGLGAGGRRPLRFWRGEL